MILIIDDEPESRTFLTAILTQEGYKVRAADSGELALSSIALRQPELILLDIRMEGMDGWDVCRRLKEDKTTLDIPVIFLSASVEPDQRVIGLKMGAVDFVTKPYQRDELLARVRTHLELRRLRVDLQRQVDERTAALRESEERFRAMADAAPVLIWASGPDKLCTFFNKRWLEFTGRGLERELGNGWAEGVHPDDLEHCYRTYSSAFDARECFEIEYRLRRSDGEFRWIVDNGVPRFSDTGVFSGYLGSAVDITDRKAAAEQLRALSASLIVAQEEERRKISRELHDDLVQRLALVAIDLGKTVSQSDSPLREELRCLQDRIVQAAELTRHFAHELHPLILEDLGLTTAVRSLGEEFAQREEIEVEVKSDNLPVSLKREAASCLYAVAGEALLNISKHARANRVSIHLGGSDRCITLSIVDNGVGLPSGAISTNLGLGIVNMRERVRWLNGRFSIESRPGGGTQVFVEIPVSGEGSEIRTNSAG